MKYSASGTAAWATIKTSELTNDSGFLTSHQSLANYVTLDGTQTITGIKRFNSAQLVSSQDALNNGNGNYGLVNTITNKLNWIDNNAWSYGSISASASSTDNILALTSQWTNGAYSKNSNTLRISCTASSKDVYPVDTNVNLGTSDHPWHTINGLNPGSLGLPAVGNANAYEIDTTGWDLTGGDIHVVVQDANGKTVPGYVMLYLSKCAATDSIRIQLTSYARSAGVYVPAIKSGSNYYVKACFPTSGDCYVNIVKTAGTIGYAKLYPFLGNQGFVHPS